MRIWVLRANATRPDDQVREFNIMSKGRTLDDAISNSIVEMTDRGWLDVEIFRTAELDIGISQTATGYLRDAIENVEAHGFSFIRYGEADH